MVALASLAGDAMSWPVWVLAPVAVIFFAMGYAHGVIAEKLAVLRNPDRPRGPRPGPRHTYGGGVGTGSKPTTTKPGPR